MSRVLYVMCAQRRECRPDMRSADIPFDATLVTWAGATEQFDPAETTEVHIPCLLHIPAAAFGPPACAVFTAPVVILGGEPLRRARTLDARLLEIALLTIPAWTSLDPGRPQT